MMGYLSWATKPSKKERGGTHGGGGERKSATPPAVVAAAAASGGCINAVLHMFDFQRFNLCLHPQLDHHDLDFDHLKGVEAPRNSLEAAAAAEETVAGDRKDDTPVETEMNTSRRDTRLKLVQAPRVKYNSVKHQEDIFTSESCGSPGGGARTPTLVARLMGLDVLPESITSTTTTPRSSMHTPQTAPPKKAYRAKPNTAAAAAYDNFGAQSLPETPRRLSFQINNKENSIVREMESSRPSCSAISTKMKQGRLVSNFEGGEIRSPRYYARQIMKQVKETVSRRSSFGADITNTINNNNNNNNNSNSNNGQRSDLCRREDEHLLTLTKPRKPHKLESNPKLQKSEPSSKLNSLKTEYAKFEALQAPPMAAKPSEEDFKEKEKEKEKEKKVTKKKKNPPKSYDSSIKNKKDEQFVRTPLTNKKCKKSPLSSDFFHGSVPSLVLQKQGPSSKAQPSKPMMTNTNVSNGAQLSRKPSQRTYEILEHKERTHAPVVQIIEKTKENNSIREFQYISRILKCTGIDRDTPVTLARWFSCSHPLDPSIFHTLEGAHYVSPLPSHGATNRRLVFHLADEILSDLLKPYVKIKSRIFGKLRQCCYNDNQQMVYGFQLVKILCTRIRSFPSANCQTLQDIDALVEKDLPRTGVQSDLIAFEEEGDTIVSEIEFDILDSLVHEIAVFFLGSIRSQNQNQNRSRSI